MYDKFNLTFERYEKKKEEEKEKIVNKITKKNEYRMLRSKIDYQRVGKK